MVIISSSIAIISTIGRSDQVLPNAKTQIMDSGLNEDHHDDNDYNKDEDLMMQMMVIMIMMMMMMMMIMMMMMTMRIQLNSTRCLHGNSLNHPLTPLDPILW